MAILRIPIWAWWFSSTGGTELTRRRILAEIERHPDLALDERPWPRIDDAPAGNLYRTIAECLYVGDSSITVGGWFRWSEDRDLPDCVRVQIRRLQGGCRLRLLLIVGFREVVALVMAATVVLGLTTVIVHTTLTSGRSSDVIAAVLLGPIWLGVVVSLGVYFGRRIRNQVRAFLEPVRLAASTIADDTRSKDTDEDSR